MSPYARCSSAPLLRKTSEFLDCCGRTKKDDTIGDILRALGFASVPLTAVFPGNDPNNPILLDGLFTASRIQDVMREAVAR